MKAATVQTISSNASLQGERFTVAILRMMPPNHISCEALLIFQQ